MREKIDGHEIELPEGWKIYHHANKLPGDYDYLYHVDYPAFIVAVEDYEPTAGALYTGPFYLGTADGGDLNAEFSSLDEVLRTMKTF